MFQNFTKSNLFDQPVEIPALPDVEWVDVTGQN